MGSHPNRNHVIHVFILLVKSGFFTCYINGICEIGKLFKIERIKQNIYIQFEK